VAPVVHVTGIGSDAYSVKAGTERGTEVTIYVAGLSTPLTAEETLGRAAAHRL
jgi:hypothetical protein